MNYRSSMVLLAGFGIIGNGRVAAQFATRPYDGQGPSCPAYSLTGKIVTINAPDARCIDGSSIGTISNSDVNLYSPPGPHQVDHLPINMIFIATKPIFKKTETECYEAFKNIGPGNGKPTLTICETKKEPRHEISEFLCDGNAQQDCVYMTYENGVLKANKLYTVKFTNPHP